MKRVFADSLYWIALSHQRDQWHAVAVRVSQAIRGTEIVTTDEVLSEFLTALRHNASLRNTATLQVRGYPAIGKSRKLLTFREVRRTHSHKDMPRCVSPTPPT
jgi:predicted nucleic acid-binding protein